MINNKNNANFRNSGEPSGFVVDLKKQLEEKEKAETGKKKRFSAEDFYEKYEGFKLSGYRNKLAVRTKEKVSAQTEKIKTAMSSVVKDSLPVTHKIKTGLNLKLEKIISFPEKFGGRARENLKNLAAFSLIRFLFKIVRSAGELFYNFCYGVGWAAVFAARLVYFSLLAALKPLIKIYGLEKFSAINTHNAPDSREAIFDYDNNKVSGGEKIEKEIPVKKERKVYFKKINALIRAIANKTKMTLTKRIEFKAPAVKKDRARKKKSAEKKTAAAAPAYPIMPRTVLLRSVYVFAAILLLIILPLKGASYYKLFKLNDLRGKVLGVSEEAIGNLKSAGESAGEMNFGDAQSDFSRAAEKFLEAQTELDSVSDLFFKIASFSSNENIRLASHSKEILAAGKEAALLGENITAAANNLFGGHEQGKELAAIIDDFILYGEKAVVNSSNIESILGNIDADDIPADYREQFLPAKEKIRFFKNSLSELVDLAKGAGIFLGMDGEKRYLFVFQNNTELRATGGFIGSFALVDFKDGKVVNLEVPEGGSYDTEAGLKDLIISPEPLHLVNPQWHFWDANWWPDWPTSARKLMWFYEKSAGPTVDGVVSLTPTVMERFLEAVGEIDMTEEYGVKINAENFWETTQFFSEKKPQETLKPKKIIGDMFEKIIEELPVRLKRETLVSLSGAIEQSLSEKHILFYFENPDLQERAERYGWDGKIKQTEWDYLSVVNTNIAGGKSDKKIRETVKHTAEIQADGSIVNTLVITREHTAYKFEPFVGVRNVDWMRIYVPLGSQLIEASGFEKPNEIYFEKPEDYLEMDPQLKETEDAARIHEGSGTKIYEEFGKTVFANWAMVDPGQTLTIYIKYSLPFKLEEKEAYTIKEILQKTLNPAQKQLHAYALLVQKQSGFDNSSVISNLKLPDNLKIIWSYPAEAEIGEKGWIVNRQLNTDLYLAAVIE